MSPNKLGRYEILGELGKGAMGVVYLAQDPIIDRQLAIKTFRMAYSAKEKEVEQFRERFLREARTVGKLSHPNIVTVHDVGEEDGEHFIAMEYIKGVDLKQQMQREDEMDLDKILGIVSQIADGLAAAHEQGVVHRDVKPANILITSEGQAKITDFGIARIEQSNLTVAGQLLGTPNYMAPEQIQGREVDSRTDIFSLGVMLYELITRKKPFQGENLTQVSHRIVYDEYTPPTEYKDDLPPELLKVLERALQKTPDDRYQDAAEMSMDIRAILNPLFESGVIPIVGGSAAGIPAYVPSGSSAAIPAATPPAGSTAPSTTAPSTTAPSTPPGVPPTPPPTTPPAATPPAAAPPAATSAPAATAPPTTAPAAAPSTPPSSASAPGKTASSGPALPDLPLDLLDDTDPVKPSSSSPPSAPLPKPGTGPVSKPAASPPPTPSLLSTPVSKPASAAVPPPPPGSKSAPAKAKAPSGSRPTRPKSGQAPAVKSKKKSKAKSRKSLVSFLVIAAVALVGLALTYLGWTLSQGRTTAPVVEELPGVAAAQREADLVAEAQQLADGEDLTAALEVLENGCANGLCQRQTLQLYLDLAAQADLDDSTGVINSYVEERMIVVEALLQAKQWEPAREVLELVLYADPEHELAGTRIDDIDRLLGRRRTPRPTSSRSPPPPPPPTRTATASPPTVQQPENGTLSIRFNTMVAAGKVKVTANGAPLFEQDFKFNNTKTFKPRFLRSAGTLGEQRTLREGSVQLRVTVEVDLKSGREVLNGEIGGNIAPNLNRTLNITVGEDAKLNVTFN